MSKKEKSVILWIWKFRILNLFKDLAFLSSQSFIIQSHTFNWKLRPSAVLPLFSIQIQILIKKSKH